MWELCTTSTTSLPTGLFTVLPIELGKSDRFSLNSLGTPLSTMLPFLKYWSNWSTYNLRLLLTSANCSFYQYFLFMTSSHLVLSSSNVWFMKVMPSFMSLISNITAGKQSLCPSDIVFFNSVIRIELLSVGSFQSVSRNASISLASSAFIGIFATNHKRVQNHKNKATVQRQQQWKG